MALQISEFAGVATAGGETVPLPDGAPLRVTDAAGAFVVGAGTVVIRIKGAGSITWPSVATAETFDGIEYRRARAGDTFVVA